MCTPNDSVTRIPSGKEIRLLQEIRLTRGEKERVILDIVSERKRKGKTKPCEITISKTELGRSGVGGVAHAYAISFFIPFGPFTPRRAPPLPK